MFSGAEGDCLPVLSSCLATPSVGLLIVEVARSWPMGAIGGTGVLLSHPLALVDAPEHFGSAAAQLRAGMPVLHHGKCEYGPACRFHHVHPDYRREIR